MTDKEAWAKFEDGLKDVTSMEEALAWVPVGGKRSEVGWLLFKASKLEEPCEPTC